MLYLPPHYHLALESIAIFVRSSAQQTAFDMTGSTLAFHINISGADFCVLPPFCALDTASLQVVCIDGECSSNIIWSAAVNKSWYIGKTEEVSPPQSLLQLRQQHSLDRGVSRFFFLGCRLISTLHISHTGSVSCSAEETKIGRPLQGRALDAAGRTIGLCSGHARAVCLSNAQ